MKILGFFRILITSENTLLSGIVASDNLEQTVLTHHCTDEVTAIRITVYLKLVSICTYSEFE